MFDQKNVFINNDNEIELTEDDKAIFNDPVKVYTILHRLKKVRRIVPQTNRYTFALKKLIEILRLIHSYLNDYNITYTIQTLDDQINVSISVKIYSEKVTPQDEYDFTFNVLRRAFPDLSDVMIHLLTREVLSRKVKFTAKDLREEISNDKEVKEECTKS